MDKRIRVVITEDHNITLEGVKFLLSTMERVEIVGDAASGRDLFVLLERISPPDVVLMDIRLPDGSGIDFTKQIIQKYPSVRVVALSMHDEEAYIVNMLQAGASGYVLKNTTRDELRRCIEQVASGTPYFGSKIAEVVLAKYMAPPKSDDSPRSVSPDVLSKREIEILKLVGQEYTTQQIAEKLFISPRTVENHRSKIMQKLDVKSTVGLIKYAIKHGLIDS
ncbi:MAG: response regulator transcription factor [Bacteroidia bacterium]|nr:response regulator transcription factor [Bacteroidia bacterium]MDW8333618.1 response regulator transcription factor [Bacteroidia bacterium]